MPEILGVRVDAIKKEKLEPKLKTFLVEGGLHKVFTPNAEMILEARRNEPFRKCLNSGDLNLADGVSIVFANLFLNFLNTFIVHQSSVGVYTKSRQKIQKRVPGVDALQLLCKIATEENKKVFFLGSDPGVGEKAAKMMKERYKSLQIRANDGGKITQTTPDPSLVRRGEEHGWKVDPEVLEDIRKFEPDILAVALGHGKQEHFICSALGDMPSIRIAIGVGGALDYLSGSVKRAPVWMRRMGFEWLYRLIQQPKRIGRIFNAVIVFPFIVIWVNIVERRGNS